MKRVLYILVCLSLASTASALSITNGDFENQTGENDIANVADWYDYQDNDDTYWNGPWFRGGDSEEWTLNDTGCLFLGEGANTDEDGGNKSWIYQSLGTYNGIPMLEIALQWGIDEDEIGGEFGLTIMILESDGTFVPGEPFVKDDIYGAGGITEIARASVIKDVDPGVVMDELFLLDISSATVGKQLFLRINNFEVDPDVTQRVGVDNITLTSLSATVQSPEDNAEFIAIERTSSENDLVFNVVDSAVSEVDVLFAAEDPNNLASILDENLEVSSGNQYTVDLEDELAEDLQNSTDYYWRVLAYEPNGMDVSLRNTGKIWSFTTVQDGPYLGPATPNPNGVFAGDNAEFTVFSSKADTFQWYKEGDPNIALSDSDPNCSGATTDTLTIVNAQLDDEGMYYCVGTETSSEKTAQSESGELYIKGLKHYFPFNSEDVVGDITLDVIGGVQAQLMGGASVEIFSEAAYSEPNSVIGDYLQLENHGESTEDAEYAQILDASVFNYPEITVSAWFRMAADEAPDSKSVIWACGVDNDNYWDFTPYIEYGEEDENEGMARSELRVSSDQSRLDVIYEVNTEQWYFVTVTFSDRTVKMYIDGEYVDTGKMYDRISDLTKTFAYIGRRIATTAGNYPMFDGSIDELKIYNYAMSTVEVAQAYLEVMTSVEYMCNEEIYDLGGYDYDENCQVDLADFAEIASRWLDDFQIS